MHVRAIVKIKRSDFEGYREFSLELPQSYTVLDLLTKMKEDMDQSISFRSMCRSGICGTCAVKVNGKPALACNTKLKELGEDIKIEPIDGFYVIKDLVVEHDTLIKRVKSARVWFSPREDAVPVSQEILNITEKSWECILCGACDSVCPVLLESPSFGGPMAFARAYKLFKDKRNKDTEELSMKLKELSINACTHCRNCSFVCPKIVMPEYLIKVEEDILAERGYTQQAGGFEFLSF